MQEQLTSDQFWQQVEMNEEMGMGENAAIQAACEHFDIEWGEWPQDEEDE